MHRLVAGCSALTLSLLTASAHAQDRKEPFRAMASATGSYVSGNLGQAQLQAMVNLSKSTKKSGYDVLGSAFRMWLRPIPDEPLLRIGDTAAVTALPFWYLGDKPFVLGTVRYEHSQLRGISSRINGGAAFGVAPVRQEQKLLRVALGAQVERTGYAMPDLSPDWVDDTTTRLVPRATLQSNGWMRLPGTRLSGRYVGGLLVNPTKAADYRWFLDASADVKIARQWSFRLAFNGLHDAVNPTGVLPTDLRTTAGFAWSTQPPGKKSG